MTASQRYKQALATCQAAGMSPAQAKNLARQIAARYTHSADNKGDCTR